MAGEFSEADVQQLVNTLRQMGVNPKADNPHDLKAWMAQYIASTDQSKPRTETKVIAGFPKVSFFSGDPKAKADTTFDLWKYEVTCLMKDGLHSREAVAQAVRKSLKGEAGRVAMRLGPSANIDTIIDKLECTYGIVETGEDIKTTFYNSEQRDIC